jgi:tRNA (guanine37-N1)-methyltransferase
VDDEPYGGGGGMVMAVPPLVRALEFVLSGAKEKKGRKTRILLTAADGKVYNQALAKELADEEHLVIICGHYKGVDERIADWVDDRISIGDYVLSGGEIPAMVIVDSVVRLIPGVVSDFESVRTDSHFSGLLGASVYTRPSEFRGMVVPEVLLSGHHDNIEEHRFFDALEKTKQVRPDMYECYSPGEREMQIIKRKAKRERRQK